MAGPVCWVGYWDLDKTSGFNLPPGGTWLVMPGFLVNGELTPQPVASTPSKQRVFILSGGTDIMSKYPFFLQALSPLPSYPDYKKCAFAWRIA